MVIKAIELLDKVERLFIEKGIEYSSVSLVGNRFEVVTPHIDEGFMLCLACFFKEYRLVWRIYTVESGMLRFRFWQADSAVSIFNKDCIIF